MKQKFYIYDLVHINSNMPDYMEHFIRDKDAIIIEYSHNKCQEGSEHEYNYELYIKNIGRCAWYHNFNLKLISRNQLELLKKWKKAQNRQDKKHADINWIFKNGKKVLKTPPGPTLTTLGKYLGINNLWGHRGEGITYYTNAKIILKFAKPFLEASNKEGWLKFTRKAV